jgi:hypothetical protein
MRCEDVRYDGMGYEDVRFNGMRCEDVRYDGMRCEDVRYISRNTVAFIVTVVITSNFNHKYSASLKIINAQYNSNALLHSILL